MFALVVLLISLALGQSYNIGAAVSAVAQPFVQSGAYPMPYTLKRNAAYCKNNGQQLAGELPISDTLVLQVTGGALACAQSVMFHVQQGMCSDVFVASTSQCACLRPGIICKEKKSTTGFAIYQLTRLGKQQSEKAERRGPCTEHDTQVACEKANACQWKDAANSCEGVSLSKAHYGAYPAPGMTPQLGAAGYGAPAYGPPGAVGVAPGMLNTQLVPWRTDMDCDREIDEHTQLSNIIDLAPARNPQECYMTVQRTPGCNQQQFVWHNRGDGYPGECACVRINLFCDEETRPGWQIFDFTKGPGAMGGVPPTAGAYPQAHGMVPSTPGVFAQARPGVASTYPGAYPQTQPGAYGGAYGATAGYPAQTGAYGARPGYTGTAGYAQPGMGYGRPLLQKSHASKKTSTPEYKLLVLYVVIPVVVGALLAAVISQVYKQCYQSKTRQQEFYSVMDDQKTPVV